MNLYFLCTLLFVTNLYSQGEANIWYFGSHAGLDFSNGAPVALTDGQIDTAEGCATISDANGQLLFYTDGKKVWNKNHQVMPNGTGLMGSSSSTQAALAIPKPGSQTIYYLFTSTDLAKWHEQVRLAGFKSFNTISRTIETHYLTILNYFDNRRTNASAESFNAKIKSFRTKFRGVRCVEFFLFRLTNLYA